MEDQSELRLQGWETGLPLPEDLTPLSQSLISPELALAFGINPDNSRVQFDLNLATHENCSTICPSEENFESLSLRLFPGRNDLDISNKLKRGECFVTDEVNSGSKDENGDENGLNRTVKRPRLVWTPQLHKRFVDVIEHLGIDKAVPKTIMEMMNVEGLTRENVASHLQKYRLYLKRMEGLSSDSHSGSRRDSPLFECDGFGSMAMQQPQTPQQPPQQQQHCGSLPLMPMPMVAPPPGAYGFGHLGLPVATSAPPGYCGLESGAYSMFWNRQRVSLCNSSDKKKEESINRLSLPNLRDSYSCACLSYVAESYVLGLDYSCQAQTGCGQDGFRDTISNMEIQEAAELLTVLGSSEL